MLADPEDEMQIGNFIKIFGRKVNEYSDDFCVPMACPYPSCSLFLPPGFL